MARQRFNPKRALAVDPDPSVLRNLVAQVRYGGNPEHKRNPGDFGLTPPAQLRPDKTACDEVGITKRSVALGLLREGIEKGTGKRASPGTGAISSEHMGADRRRASGRGSIGKPRGRHLPRIPNAGCGPVSKDRHRELDGMSKQFKIGFEWIARDFGDPVDRYSLARIRIEAGGISATDVEDLQAKTVRSDIRVSAFDFAAWLVGNWWRLRWEPDNVGHADGGCISWDMSHKIAAAGNGYLWPDMEFSSSGDSVHVRAHPTGAVSGQSLRFLNEIDVHVPAGDFESEVREFVDAVVSRVRCLSDASQRSRELEAAWHELGEELRDPDRSFARAMEARMGFDPEEADPAMLDSLREAAELVGRGAIEELASSSKRNTIEDLKLIQGKLVEPSTALSLDVSSTARKSCVRGEVRRPPALGNRGESGGNSAPGMVTWKRPDRQRLSGPTV